RPADYLMTPLVWGMVIALPLVTLAGVGAASWAALLAARTGAGTTATRWAAALFPTVDATDVRVIGIQSALSGYLVAATCYPPRPPLPRTRARRPRVGEPPPRGPAPRGSAEGGAASPRPPLPPPPPFFPVPRRPPAPQSPPPPAADAGDVKGLEKLTYVRLAE